MKFPKRQRQSKGFTLTELAVVIAVIAVLIAVLVPTFISLINSANESTQQQESKNINTTLSTGSALNGTPTNIGDVIDILVADGYSEELTTNSSDTEYIWVKEDNIVVLYNFTEDRSIYPEGYDLKGKTYSYFTTNSDTNAGFAAGDGTEDNPYEIATLNQLESLRKLIETDGKDTTGLYFKLDRNLELGNDWSPLGSVIYEEYDDGFIAVSYDSDYSFKGNFDGGNKTLTVSNPPSYFAWSSDYSIFACILGTKENPASVKNLNIEMDIAYDDIGSDCNNGYCYGLSVYAEGDGVDSLIFENITVTGNIVAGCYASGVVGTAYGCTFKNCVNYADITTFDLNWEEEDGSWINMHSFIGGICAQACSYLNTTASVNGGYSDVSVKFENCANYGTLTYDTSIWGSNSNSAVWSTCASIGNIVARVYSGTTDNTKEGYTQYASAPTLTFVDCIAEGKIIGGNTVKGTDNYYYFEGYTNIACTEKTYSTSANYNKLLIGGGTCATTIITVNGTTTTYKFSTVDDTLPNGTSN